MSLTLADGSTIWLGDAKYRATRQGVLNGMQSAHIYQDSLRWHDARPEATLLPVPARSTATDCLMTPEYRNHNAVGAIVAAPEGLERLIERMMRTESRSND